MLCPVATLTRVHQLEYGAFGPASKLSSSYPTLSRIVPLTQRVTVDGAILESPTFAASTSDPKKFFSEIEALEFLGEIAYEATDEIFRQTVMFTVHDERDQDAVGIPDAVCINGMVLVSFGDAASIILHDFPREFRRWDTQKLAEFEAFLDRTLNQSLYKAIVRCLPDAKDKETTRERRRIVIALMLFNRASRVSASAPFSGAPVIFLAAAFEALLDLPSETIEAAFEHAVTMLAGAKSSLVRKWCKQFYGYRSALVHGDASWEGDEKTFDLPGNTDSGRPLSVLGRHLFVHCLKTRLFLMGFFPEYQKEQFDFQALAAQPYRVEVSRDEVVIPRNG